MKMLKSLLIKSFICTAAMSASVQLARPAMALEAATEIASENQTYSSPSSSPGKKAFTADDEKFLDDFQRRGILFFIDEADSNTGLMPDRAKADGSKAGDVASIASVGFGITALCIADERGWMPHQEAYDRCLKVLRFLRDKAPQEHGHFYHFLNMKTGERAWNSEVSNIDTALLMAGVLTVRQHFPNTELATLANELYERVEWPWLLTPDGTLCMGWTPEKGFIKAKWQHYNEGYLICLLGLGSKTHPLKAEHWKAWQRVPVMTYAGLTFMQCPPLFTHQYPQCWFDLRGQRDDVADYFENAQLATIAQRQWCIEDLSKEYPQYGPDYWGITASDGPNNYQAWGGPPMQGDVDGSVVPAAAAGSLAFQPKLCIDVLRAMHKQHGQKAYLKYGFVDAFNPAKNWYNKDVLGIDVGPSVLMAENARSEFVWKTFMSSPEAQAALKVAGFRPVAANDASVTTSMFSDVSASSNEGSGK